MLSAKAQNAAVDDLGWRIGSQAYTFRLFTLEEALGKLNTLGLKYVELYPGQKIGAGMGDETTNHNASPETIQKLKQLIKSKGIQPVGYDVVNGKNEAEWRKDRKSVEEGKSVKVRVNRGVRRRIKQNKK